MEIMNHCSSTPTLSNRNLALATCGEISLYPNTSNWIILDQTKIKIFQFNSYLKLKNGVNKMAQEIKIIKKAYQSFLEICFFAISQKCDATIRHIFGKPLDTTVVVSCSRAKFEK